MRTLPARLLVLLAALLACALGACSRRAPISAPQAAAAAANTDEVPVVSAPAPTPSREIQLRRESASPQAASAAPNPLEKEEQSLLALPGPTVLPEDFKIGALADLFAADSSARAAASAARQFLDALAQGRVSAELIESGRRAGLQNSLAYYLSAGLSPRSYRLGAAAFVEGAPDETRMNVRLFGSPGRTEGEMYLTRVSQRWYVLDLQVELAALRRPYSRPEARFYPSVYAWGLD